MQVEFKTVDDMVRYLDNTICMYKGNPVHVRVTGNSLTNVNVFTINSRPTQTNIECTDEGFQAYPFELGLVNTGNGVCFLSRGGYRHSNYGLRLHGITIENLDDEEGLSVGMLPKSKAFCDCLKNEYPTFKEALDKVIATGSSCAFNKYYHIGCVEKDDDSLIGIFFLNSDTPFAAYDESTKKFSVALRTQANKAFYAIACKSQIIPPSYQ